MAAQLLSTIRNDVPTPVVSDKFGNVPRPKQVFTDDGAIDIQPRALVIIDKGSAAALTLATPTATTHDGWTITVVAKQRFAHTITTPAGKLAGAATLTFANGAAGVGTSEAVELVAYDGIWYAFSARGAHSIA